MSDDATNTVETIFSVVDQSSDPLSKIVAAGNATSKSLESAHKQADQLSRTSLAAGKSAKTPKTPKTPRPSWMDKLSDSEREKLKTVREQRSVEHARKQLSGEDVAPHEKKHKHTWMDKLDEAERERFIEEKQELQLRKARIRGQKLEQSKEQAVHRAADVALLLTGSEENKFAKMLAKTGGMGQAVGNSMVGLGGTFGKVGEKMAALGGYAALAGVAVEGIATIDEWTGGHLEKAGEELVNWTQHLIGMSNTSKDVEDQEEVQAKYLGFKNVADYKSAEATEKRWKEETRLSSMIRAQLSGMKAKPTNGNEKEMAEYRESLVKAAQNTTRYAPDESFEQVMKMYEAASEHTSQAVLEHANREAELSDVELTALNGLKALPIEPNAEQMQAHTDEIANTVRHLSLSNQITEDEVELVTKNLVAKSAEGEGILNLIERHKELADAEASAEVAARQYAKLMPRIPVHATVEQMHKFNDAMAQFTALAVNQLGLKSSEQVKMFQQKLETKAHHFDFRGSRFDIKQAFSDIDPDRIAIAFSNDLAGLGERRVQSSFAPLFAV